MEVMEDRPLTFNDALWLGLILYAVIHGVWVPGLVLVAIAGLLIFSLKKYVEHRRFQRFQRGCQPNPIRYQPLTEKEELERNLSAMEF